MSSIIEGYNYDIFISYRQKDNKGDGWVSEFVEALKTELESTFKEDISVYFDINPHDGLLETHDVGASLKEKLKCLIFIPIISRTYCDPKAFAWEHEFKAFAAQASQDQFGLKVKLPNGNIASRVLPVRIHDLDNADVELCETILGGVLRGIEFIYKSPGVNRPLRSKEDKSHENLNNTIYRDQINKVALAIKDIIIGLMTEPLDVLTEKSSQRKSIEEIIGEEKIQKQVEPSGRTKQKIIYGILISAIVIIAAIFAIPKIFKQERYKSLISSDGSISIAVWPFQNMTNDTAKNFWQDYIQDILICSLANSEELKVKQTETVKSLLEGKGITDYADIKPSVAGFLSQKLEANVFIYGRIMQDGSTIRYSLQLINSKTNEVIKPFQLEGPARQEMIFPLMDSLSRQVKNFLIISILEKKVIQAWRPLVSTNSPEAYKYFTLGINAGRIKQDNFEAIKWYTEALKADSNFFMAKEQLALISNTKLAKQLILQLHGKSDQLPMILKIKADYLYARYFETPIEEIKYLKQYLELDDQAHPMYFELGRAYMKLGQYDKAIPEFEKASEILKKWDIKPLFIGFYPTIGFAYHKTGEYRKEKRLYYKAEQDFPDYFRTIFLQAVLALSEGKKKAANEYIEKYKSICRENSWDESRIMENIARIYSDAGILDKAEVYYREVLTLERSAGTQNTLAYFLIDNDRNVNEGLILVEAALESSPDSFEYLHTKGWGLYKQGRYQEAEEVLQKSWDLRREQAVYNHEAYLHLEAAKKAVEGQNN